VLEGADGRPVRQPAGRDPVGRRARLVRLRREVPSTTALRVRCPGQARRRRSPKQLQDAGRPGLRGHRLPPGWPGSTSSFATTAKFVVKRGEHDARIHADPRCSRGCGPARVWPIRTWSTGWCRTALRRGRPLTGHGRWVAQRPGPHRAPRTSWATRWVPRSATWAHGRQDARAIAVESVASGGLRVTLGHRHRHVDRPVDGRRRWFAFRAGDRQPVDRADARSQGALPAPRSAPSGAGDPRHCRTIGGSPHATVWRGPGSGYWVDLARMLAVELDRQTRSSRPWAQGFDSRAGAGRRGRSPRPPQSPRRPRLSFAVI